MAHSSEKSRQTHLLDAPDGRFFKKIGVGFRAPFWVFFEEKLAFFNKK